MPGGLGAGPSLPGGLGSGVLGVSIESGALASRGSNTTTPALIGAGLLVLGLGLIVLRRTDPNRERPFRVPLYPITPILFCLMCGYLLYSSLVYAASKDANIFGWIGIGVLLLGVPLMFVAKGRHATAAE